MADKKRDILEFFEQSNFEQFTPTRHNHNYKLIQFQTIFSTTYNLNANWIIKSNENDWNVFLNPYNLIQIHFFPESQKQKGLK
jgi:hypothetical protein